MVNFVGNAARWASVIAAALMFFGCGNAQEQRDEAHQRVANGAMLVDVRTPQEFAAGHIEGARNIPVQELPSRLAELGTHDQSIVVYCASGRRSARANELMQQAGYTKVYDLGAMSNW